MSYVQGILNQDLGFIRPKNIVMEGLSKKLDDLGEFRTRFDLTFEYPRLETIAHDDSNGATRISRRIVIKKIQSVPKLKAIDQMYSSEESNEANIAERIRAEGFGQLDSHMIEISVWSVDPNDRDNLIDLIKIWMLELNRNVEEDGLPFFYSRGVYSVEEVKINETLDRQNISSPFHVGILVFELLCPFYAIHTETFTRYKFALISNIVNNDGTGGADGGGSNSGTIIIDPDKPVPPVTGGGGSVGDNGTIPEVVVIKDTKLESVPGGEASNGKEKSDTLTIPGPNTEEHSIGGLNIPLGG